jgi:adenylate cyclase
MNDRFDYTTWARSFALRHPRTSFMGIQINFWIIAFLILTTVIHFTSLAMTKAYTVQIPFEFLPSLIISVIGGIFYGVALGRSDQWLEDHVLKSRSLGVAILGQTLTYFVVLIAMMTFTRFVVFEYLVLPFFFNGVSPIADETAWKYYFYVVMIYTFPMGLVISFINQMNKKFGPGVLVPLLLGKYRNPKEEERVFMFMDLHSSTSHAEKLGHIKYSSLIRDSFLDISRVLSKHQAEVYQYVGDEIVVSWPVKEGTKGMTCIEFCFGCQLAFNLRQSYYNENYGFVPRFKAGLHLGIVTAVEVGEIKRDIAYHGDTLNTASRIQAKCKEYKSDLLISDVIERRVSWTERFRKTFVGAVSLRGREAPVNLFSIQPKFA